MLYADVLFLVDFSMDTVALWLTSKLIHSQIKAVRCALAAGLGALVSTVLTILLTNATVSLVLGITVSFIMCLIAFGYGGIFNFTKMFAVLWTVGMVIGGIMTFLLSRGHYSRVYTNGVLQAESSVQLLPIAVGLCSVFVYFLRRISRKRSVRVLISFDSDTIDAVGIVDSGNFLRDPVSGDCVIVVTRDLLPNKLRNVDAFDYLSVRECGFNGKLRLIPVTGVDGNTLLTAIRPNKVILDGREVRCMVAISEAEDNKKKCIVPESLM